MRLARLVVASVVCMGFAWLYRYTGPLFWMFRLDLNACLSHKTGAFPAFMGDQAVTAIYSMNMLGTGWSIVKTVWPFVVFGLLLGLAIGYPLGELARRKYAIEQASDEAIRLSENLYFDAQQRERRGEKTLEKVRDIYAETIQMKEELAREQHEAYIMKSTAETELEAVEGIRKKNAILHAELVKAKAKIQRLEKKLALNPIL